jgi:hypothetical protein
MPSRTLNPQLLRPVQSASAAIFSALFPVLATPNLKAQSIQSP